MASDELNQTSEEHLQAVEWVIVAHAPGLEAASILVGRLRTIGIPARAWEEGARRAIPLTVGILGEAFVAVPAEFAAQAEQVLSDELEVEDEDIEEEDEEDEEEDEEED